MRVWDIDPKFLCGRHLLGEHNELHAVWPVITEKPQGLLTPPRDRPMEGQIERALPASRKTAKEMEKRGFNHKSPLDKRRATRKAVQDELVDLIEIQERLLSEKDTDCAERLRMRKSRRRGE